MLIKRPANRPPVAQIGPDQVLYAGPDGTAAVTLNGANSTDPDGDPLSYTWAWVLGGTACLSNGVSLTISLPVGVHSIQLMANDGQASSQPAQVMVTVVSPPTVVLMTQTNGTIAFTRGAIAGRKYQVQYTTNLPSGTWRNLGDAFAATNTTVSASDVVGPDTKRFYRLAVMP